jgi:MYXO-CTERM domain-containing protein
MNTIRKLVGGSALLLSLLSGPTASAFCGFYVSGATGELYNNATQVVLMREGTRTVLSMANNYQGPPSDFAMVVPVPVILQKENVKTLPTALFKKIDELAAPRLVEYWEQDPCAYAHSYKRRAKMETAPAPMAAAPAGARAADLGVTVEAQFEVGEYEVVILSAKDSTGLDTWLRQENYSIPASAEPVLKPYVQAGMKFFVAKVDINKVQKNGDRTMLSPLRFHYDSEKFELPVRLGLLNSSGKQDLLVHVLARGKRYEVANYPNVTIPTNLDVGEITKEQFAAFYAALFDQTLEKNPRAVVTEYAWDASTCDPCPGPTLSFQDLTTLGGDVLHSSDETSPLPPRPSPPGAPVPQGVKPDPSPVAPSPAGRPATRRWHPSGFVLTRLHARYGKESLGEDLVFREAPAIAGGREVRSGGKLEQGASTQASVNNFQGRYAIRHPWKGPVTCKEPRFGNWGGPPPGSSTQPRAATDAAFAPRGKVALASFLAQDLPELNLKGQAAPVSPVPLPPGMTAPSAAPSASPAPGAEPARGCLGCAVPAPTPRAPGLLALLALGLLGWRRKKKGEG